MSNNTLSRPFQERESKQLKFTPRNTLAKEPPSFGNSQQQFNNIKIKTNVLKQNRSNRPSVDKVQEQLDARFSEISKFRKSLDKHLKSKQQQTKKQQIKTPFRQRMNSYMEDKKTINTYRTEKQKKLNLSETINNHETNLKPTQNLQTFSLLIQQNEKLAIRIGELQTLCEAMNDKLKFFKSKFDQKFSKAQSLRIQKLKQNILLEKQVEYYKSMCKKLYQRLIEAGVDISEEESESICIQ